MNKALDKIKKMLSDDPPCPDGFKKRCLTLTINENPENIDGFKECCPVLEAAGVRRVVFIFETDWLDVARLPEGRVLSAKSNIKDLGWLFDYQMLNLISHKKSLATQSATLGVWDSEFWEFVCP